jgi:hypothetical protein
MHPADVPVGDPSRKFQLIPESFNRLFVGGNFRVQELKGHLLLNLFVQDFVDLSHAAATQFFDNLVSSGVEGSLGQFSERKLESLCGGKRRLFGKGQIEPTASAEAGIGGILKETFGAFHGPRLLYLRKKKLVIGCAGRVGVFDSTFPSIVEENRKSKLKKISRTA